MHTTNFHRLEAAIALIAAAIFAGGRPLYAGATCSVSADGSTSYRSIQTAVLDPNCATIKVKPGQYTENVYIRRSVNIVGSGAANTIISGKSNIPPQTVSIAVDSGPVKIDGVTIQGGNAVGGITNVGNANLYILNCIVTGAQYSGLWTVGSGTVQIEDSTFSQTKASNDEPGQNGYAIEADGGTVNIIRSTIANNYNGVFVGNNGTISNSTIAHTSIYGISLAEFGLSPGKTLSISSSTVANNLIGLFTNSTAVVSMRSSIIANNGTNCYWGTHFTDGGNNLRWPASQSACIGSYGNPNLGPLAGNGGLNQTMMPLAGSAAISGGACGPLNGVAGAAVPVDERLYLRPASGCDIGAVESRSTTLSVPDAGWWRLDEGSGTIAHDSSVHGVNGTVYASGGPPQWMSDATAPTLFYNPSSLYSGALNSQVVTPIPSTLTDNLTVSMWVNCGGCNTSRNDYVLFYNGEFRWDGYGLYVPATNRHVELIVNGAVHDFGYTLPTTWQWTHLAIVRSNGWWLLYVNGNPVWSFWNWTPNTPVGHASIGADTFGGENFGGLIDDVRVYNRVLPVGEIAWLASGDR